MYVVIAIVAAVMALGGIFGGPSSAQAATTFSPTRFDDPAPDACRPNDCSLREAITAANAVSGSTVRLQTGTYKLTRAGADASAPDSRVGDLDIVKGMTIRGVGQAGTIIQFGPSKGHGGDRIFDVFSTAKVTISHLTVRFGTDVAAGTGGCVRNTGQLLLSNVTVSGCTSPIAGGGIASYNALTVKDSVISNNSVSSATVSVNGGGIISGPKTTNAPGSVTIIHSQIIDNTARSARLKIGLGGGFANTATMFIRNSTIRGNQADSAAGGFSNSKLSNPDGAMKLARTSVLNNKATRDAGGVANDGLMTVNASTFSGNVSGYHCSGDDCNHSFAGGLLNTAVATTNIYNSTFSGNSCRVSGGGLVNSGDNVKSGVLRLYNSTIVKNSCPLGPGLTSNPSGETYLKNTILANNSGAGPSGDCGNFVTSLGHNIIGKVGTCSIVGDTTGNKLGVNPKVGPLQDNGGPTFTHALLAGSPAIDAGDPSGCTDTTGIPLTTDQRGFTRPVGDVCDIGSYEKGS